MRVGFLIMCTEGSSVGVPRWLQSQSWLYMGQGQRLPSVDILSRALTWGKPSFLVINVVTFFSTVWGLKDFF